MPAHVRKLREAYSVRLNAMAAAMQKHFPASARYIKPQGGLFIWVTLPERVDTSALLKKAVTHNVAFVPGVDFHADGSGANTMRLNFSASPVAKIEEGIERLGKLLTEELS